MQSMVKNEFMSSLVGRDFLAVFVVIVNAFSWYFPAYIFFSNTLGTFGLQYNSLLLIFGVHYITVVAFAIIGTALVNKVIRRSTLISIWMLIGTGASASMSLLESGQLQLIYLISFALGLSLGLGFPSCLAYFAEYSPEGHRGRLGGLTNFGATLGMFLVGMLISMTSFTSSILILTSWRGIGLIIFSLVKRGKNKEEEKTARVSYRTILHERSFHMYLLPWIMFCLVNFFEGPIQTHTWGVDFVYLISIAEFGIASISTLVGGFFSDLIGRKRIVIFAFVTLGLGYAVLGLFSSDPLALYVYTVLDGVAWGIFSLMFYMIIWGDLARNHAKDKYYLVGGLPFLISSYISVLVTPIAGSISVSASFSLAAFFLFLAVLPLMFAPETLSEKKIKDRELKQYIEKAKKAREEQT